MITNFQGGVTLIHLRRGGVKGRQSRDPKFMFTALSKVASFKLALCK